MLVVPLRPGLTVQAIGEDWEVVFPEGNSLKGKWFIADMVGQTEDGCGVSLPVRRVQSVEVTALGDPDSRLQTPILIARPRRGDIDLQVTATLDGHKVSFTGLFYRDHYIGHERHGNVVFLSRFEHRYSEEREVALWTGVDRRMFPIRDLAFISVKTERADQKRASLTVREAMGEEHSGWLSGTCNSGENPLSPGDAFFGATAGYFVAVPVAAFRSIEFRLKPRERLDASR